MLHDAPTELPEQHLSKELMRICAEWQRGAPADHSLVELFDVLIHYDRESDGDPQTWIDKVARFSEREDGPPGNHRLSILVALLQDIQARVRCRVSNLAERIVAYDAARQANASYGGVAHREYAAQTPPAFLYQS